MSNRADQPKDAAAPQPDECCSTCKHSMTDNRHGFDQNDGYMDGDKLVLYGTCTYCKLCNPRLFAAPQPAPAEPPLDFIQQAINLCFSERNRWHEGDKEWVHWNEVAALLQGDQLARKVREVQCKPGAATAREWLEWQGYTTRDFRDNTAWGIKEIASLLTAYAAHVRAPLEAQVTELRQQNEKMGGEWHATAMQKRAAEARNKELEQALRDGRYRVGPWLSAALEWPDVCKEMKADIERWMEITEAALTAKPE